MYTGKSTFGDLEYILTVENRLWGNPTHLAYLASAVQEKHSKEKLHVLVVARNSDYYTYDGIDIGAERVAQEVEETVEEWTKTGHTIKKFSIVGYSLGGLIARYTIGLLYSRGFFNEITPVNFTTFASPHLGVRTPWRGFPSAVWNTLGGNTLSVSGRQLFLIDQFRDTGRPLLSVLADPKSVFIEALSHFKHRVLYPNITNDRSAPYYTTSISKVDPYVDLENLKIDYVKGYEPVIVALHQPRLSTEQEVNGPIYTRIFYSVSTAWKDLPVYALWSLIIVIGPPVFLVNAGIQSWRSYQRIRLHEAGKMGIISGTYRIPLIAEQARNAVEGAVRNVNAAAEPDYLNKDGGSTSQPDAQTEYLLVPGRSQKSEKTGGSPDETDLTDLTDSETTTKVPTLALTQEQFEMIEALDNVGWRKFPVYIHKVRHSHAAIIVRKQKENFFEGKIVVKHWLEEAFEI